MEVILTENVPQVGFVGDVVKVKAGFFRNFLFPKKLAVVANPINTKQIEHQKKLISIKKAEKKDEAEALKKRLDKVSLSIARAVSENDKLFGAISTSDIVEGLIANGFEIDKRWVKFSAPVRELGSFKAEIHLHQDVIAYIPFTVVKKES